MAKQEEVHVTTDQARAGATPHMTRVILPVSLALVIAVFVAILFVWR